jgi:hypothetical protein
MAEKTYVESLGDYIAQQIKPGNKLIVETSNESGHLDLETGEYVRDFYSEDRYGIPNRGSLG